MKLPYLLLAVLILTACGGRKISASIAVDTITGAGNSEESFKKNDVDVLNIMQVSRSEAIVETKLRTAFRMEKVGDSWVVREVRIGRSQWEKVSNLGRALEMIRIEETRKMLDRVVAAIIKYRESKGSWPAFKDYVSLSDVLSPTYLTPLIRLDAWRKPFEASFQNSNTILLRSAGPDGKFGTSDDIRKIVP
jgi:hypothetical protein